MQRILVLGETLWDCFAEGPRFGGAAANFACAAARLARGLPVEVALASAVGRDSLGDAAEAQLRAAGVRCDWLARVDAATGRVLVEVDRDGQPRYRFADAQAWDAIPWDQNLDFYAAGADLIYFGTLAQRAEPSRTTIQHLLQSAPRVGRVRLLDLNLRAPFWDEPIIRQSLELADALKLNVEELPAVMRATELTGDRESVMAALAERYALQWLALTLGADGSILYTPGHGYHSAPATKVEVVDTVGAGDAFAAALALGGLRRPPTHAAQRWASEVAAFVCSQPGATPDFPERLTLESSGR